MKFVYERVLKPYGRGGGGVSEAEEKGRRRRAEQAVMSNLLLRRDDVVNLCKYVSMRVCGLNRISLI